MSDNFLEKYFIYLNSSLIQALKKMDSDNTKSLIVIDEKKKFISVLSIGDVQRAIIKNTSLDTLIYSVLRKTVLYATTEDSISKVKEKMLNLRIELMPIVDANFNVVKLISWSDLFKQKFEENKISSDIPVVIMAGGLGSRLRPLTNVIPKPLLPIGEKSIIEIIIDNFKEFGLNNFFITTNYKSELIEFHFKNKKCDFSYSLAREEKPLGTAGSLYLLKDKLRNTFFLSNCDILVNSDYKEIFDYHLHSKNIITIVASVKDYSIPYGTIECGENGELKELKEKPNFHFMINTGMYIIEPEVFKYIENDVYLDMTTLIEIIASNAGRIGVFPISDKSWTDIGEWDQYIKIIQQK